MYTSTLGPVLVTGGNGFLARHTIAQLLADGQLVRTTVRSPGRADALRHALAAAGADTRGFKTVEADLLSPAGWDGALEGVGSVLHMATPMAGHDVLAAAVDGTRTVLEASARAGVRRIVFTSTGLAAMSARNGVMTEADWTDPDQPGLSDYARAKTLAERLAWDLARRHGLELTTILPGAILGPRLGQDRPGWLGLVDGMLAGKLRALPPIRLQMVDVRDLALLHIAALRSDEARGQRYIAMDQSYSFREVAVLLKAHFGDAAARVSTTEMASWLLRVAALVSDDARRAVPLMGARATLSAEKARSELGWEPRPVRQSIIDTAASLLSDGQH